MNTTAKQTCTITIARESLELLPRRAIFWPAQFTLIVADLHLGKAATFRQNGIAVPEGSADDDLSDLSRLIHRYEVKRCLFLGDLFHSSYNAYWQTFANWCDQHADTEFVLVKGNHDILNRQSYENAGIQIRSDNFVISPFNFAHHPGSSESDDLYSLCGHLHPAVQMKGKGRQYSKIACFYFGKTEGVLPAFGGFTGTSVIQPTKEDRVFVALENTVIPV